MKASVGHILYVEDDADNVRDFSEDQKMVSETRRARSIRLLDDCVSCGIIAFPAFQAFHPPGVWCVKGAIHCLSLGNIEVGGTFVIQVFIEGGSAAPYTPIDVERTNLKRELGAEELDNSSARSEIKSAAIYLSRKMSVKITEGRIKVDFDYYILDRLVRNVLDLHPGLVASGKDRRLTIV